LVAGARRAVIQAGRLDVLGDARLGDHATVADQHLGRHQLTFLWPIRIDYGEPQGTYAAVVQRQARPPDLTEHGAVLAAVKDASRRAKRAVAYGHP